ncbi:hypothetical protein SprV_0100061800 [Sparganum proliferum]
MEKDDEEEEREGRQEERQEVDEQEEEEGEEREEKEQPEKGRDEETVEEEEEEEEEEDERAEEKQEGDEEKKEEEEEHDEEQQEEEEEDGEDVFYDFELSCAQERRECVDEGIEVHATQSHEEAEHKAELTTVQGDNDMESIFPVVFSDPLTWLPAYGDNRIPVSSTHDIDDTGRGNNFAEGDFSAKLDFLQANKWLGQPLSDDSGDGTQNLVVGDD